MTASFPFAGGTLSQAQWRNMSKGWMRNGVVLHSAGSNMAVSLGTGLQLNVAAGYAWVSGEMIQYDSSTVTVPSTVSTEYIVARNNASTISVTHTTAVGDNDVLLATCVHTASAVTTLTDSRVYAGETALTILAGTGFDYPASGRLPTGIAIPYASRIVRWEAVTSSPDNTGTMSLTVIKDAYSTYTISSGTDLFTASVTGYKATARVSHDLAAGDYIRINIGSGATLTQTALTLYLAPIQVPILT